jgi:hypothetical protein
LSPFDKAVLSGIYVRRLTVFPGLVVHDGFRVMGRSPSPNDGLFLIVSLDEIVVVAVSYLQFGLFDFEITARVFLLVLKAQCVPKFVQDLPFAQPHLSKLKTQLYNTE